MVNLKDMQNSFWGVTLEGEKKYSQIVETGFHISMAALEPQAGLSKEDSVISVMLQSDHSEFLLCTLQQEKLYQQPLDLNFDLGDEVTFYLTGKGRVHLTGNLLPDDDLEGFGSENESSGDSEDEAPELQTTLETTRDDDSDDESDERMFQGHNKRKRKPDRVEVKRIKQMIADLGSSSDDSDADGETDDDDEDDNMNIDSYLEGEDFDSDEWESDDEDGEHLEDAKKKKSPKKSLNVSLANAKDKQKKLGDTPKSKHNTPKIKSQKSPKSKQNTPKSNQQQETPPSSPEKMATGEATSEKKKKKKKNKNKGDQTPNAAGDAQTPSSSHNRKGTPHPKMNNGDTPTSSKKANKSKPNTPMSGKKLKLTGGVQAEILKEGHGPEAKPGQQVGVYYTGKLTNNKVFDSTTSGKPFKFTLGKSEVIPGWDIGVKGMKVGGKRRLTIPAKLAYGTSKMAGIPANSPMIFEVELKTVN